MEDILSRTKQWVSQMLNSRQCFVGIMKVENVIYNYCKKATK
jgi:hypothetical protein